MDGGLFFDTYPARDSAPPRHSERGAHPSASASDNQPDLPPSYLEKIRFPVGGTVPLEPFATISQLKAHLGLLKAFGELKNRVTDLEANQDVRNELPSLARELEPQRRWIWFLELALERCMCCDPSGYPVLANL